MKKLDRNVLPALAAAYFIYVCLRAWLLPLTTDEGATWWNYVPDPVADLLAYTDPIPNNHLLNTLLIKFFTQFLPVHQFTLRIPALLGGAAYLIASVGIGRELKWPFWARLLLFVSLCGNHFVCDFLSLARGYGMSAGYLLVGVWMAVRFVQTQRLASLRWAMFWAGLSVFASFTAVNFFLPFCLCLGWVVLKRKLGRRFWLSILAGIAALAAVCYLPFKRMSETDQFHFWSAKSFYDDTVLTTAQGYVYLKRWLGFAHPLDVANGFAVVWAIWGLVAVLLFFKKRKDISEPVLFVWLLLTGTVAVTILQAYLIKTPYLSGRTAVIFWPMLAFGVPFLAVRIWEKRPLAGQVFGLLIAGLFAAHFLACAQLKSCREWWHDAETFEVLDYLKKIKDERGDGRKITLSSYWLMVNSVAFAVEYQRTADFEPVHYQTESNPNDPNEFVYTIRSELPVYENNFSVIWEVEAGGRYLLKRKN